MRFLFVKTPGYIGIPARVRMFFTPGPTDSPTTALTVAPAAFFAASALAIQMPRVSYQANWATRMLVFASEGSALIRATTGSVSAVAVGYGKK